MTRIAKDLSYTQRPRRPRGEPGAGAIVDSATAKPPRTLSTPRSPSIVDLCQPQPDGLAGRVADADFAADLATVIGGKARGGGCVRAGADAPKPA